jgi:ribosome-associated protein
MDIGKVEISTAYIKADQFLKWIGVASTGSEAKEIIRTGQVKINGEVITERGKKLRNGDKIKYKGTIYEIFSSKTEKQKF